MPAHAADRVFWIAVVLASRLSCLLHWGPSPLAAKLIAGHGAGDEREPRPGRPDAAGAHGWVPGWPGCRPGAWRLQAIRGRGRTPARDHPAGPALERRGGAAIWSPRWSPDVAPNRAICVPLRSCRIRRSAGAPRRPPAPASLGCACSPSRCLIARSRRGTLGHWLSAGRVWQPIRLRTKPQATPTTRTR